jgi:hypothetical protein
MAIQSDFVMMITLDPHLEPKHPHPHIALEPLDQDDDDDHDGGDDKDDDYGHVVMLLVHQLSLLLSACYHHGRQAWLSECDHLESKHPHPHIALEPLDQLPRHANAHATRHARVTTHQPPHQDPRRA